MNIRKRLIKRFAGEIKRPSAESASLLNKISRGRNIYHFGRRPVAGGVALGFFLAFIPVPIQMLLAAPLAFLFRVNLPVAIAATWLSNPLTLAPILLLSFKAGSLIIGGSDQFFIEEFSLSVSWLMSVAADVWLPLIVGSIACGLLAALTGYTGVMWAWRLSLLAAKKKKLIHKKT
jgi:uncharacterized protein (DUF2062 family)